MREMTIEDKLTTVVNEYFGYYRENISIPFVYNELVKATAASGQEPHPQNEIESCCAFSSTAFKQIVHPFIIDDNDKIDSFIEDNTNCFWKKRVTWKRNYRLGKEKWPEDFKKPVGKEYDKLEICKFLTISLFTEEYHKNPSAFEKMLSIFECGVSNFSNSTCDEDEIIEFKKHLEGDIGSIVGKYQWELLLDQTLIMYQEYKKQCKWYSKTIHNIFNDKSIKNKIGYAI